MEESVTLNGNDFLLTADTDKKGFYGRWTCKECGGTGVSNHLDPTEERAITAVKIGASLHTANCPKKKIPDLMDELKKDIFKK